MICNPHAVQCQYFYRDKEMRHFTKNQTGKIQVYLKDTNGDPANPINERLSGIFFGAWMHRKTGYPPATSIYGPERLYIHPSVLLNDQYNLYFSDFYCLNKSHYILLVITKKFTENDKFCEKYIEKLDMFNNQFLWITPLGSIMVTTKMWVEIFFTDDINLPNILNNKIIFIKYVKYNKQSSPGPKSKNTNCKVCNIDNTE